MRFAKEFYEGTIQENLKRKNDLSFKVNVIGIIRFMILAGWAILSFILYKANKINLICIESSILLVIFIIVLCYHQKLFEQRKKSEILIQINEDGLKRLDGGFKKFEDKGLEYLDDDHPFINDLDIFGVNSLFQLINTTVTKGGRNYLVHLLKQDKKLNKDQILDRQKAVEELGQKVEWRQNVMVCGKLKKSKHDNLDRLILWANDKKEYEPLRTVIASTFVIVTIASIWLVLKNIIPQTFLLLVFMVNYCVIKILSKGIKDEVKLFESIKKDISAYSEILKLIEDEEFKGPYLENLRSNLKNDSTSCKMEMKKLADIVEWLGDSSYNSFYFIINIILFADIFLIRSIQKWKERNGDKLEKWLEVMHEIDALNSISNLAFDHHNEWSYPQISNENIIEGINVGHPLIGERAVTNTFILKDKHKAALVTGSNMSGKSTFLRTMGINLILSYIGAPVFADEFKCGIMSVYTCMRTKDNLEESISSFYAEILRIKILIESCKRGEKVFFLLDEIFKGTNSMDRHTGAKMLIEQLIKYGAIGIVSTHDLELCDLESIYESIVNYNFREFYENNKIKFDYILRKGKSETRNAIHLMRLAGIEIK